MQPALSRRASCSPGTSACHVQGVKFLALSPGEFFFTTIKVSGYAGLLVATPTVLYEVIAYVIPGLTRSERKFLAPLIFGSSILFYVGLLFSYEILTPAALSFFVSYADGAVESFWSIDQYFEFVLVLMLSTGLAFQVRPHAVRGVPAALTRRSYTRSQRSHTSLPLQATLAGRLEHISIRKCIVATTGTTIHRRASFNGRWPGHRNASLAVMCAPAEPLGFPASCMNGGAPVQPAERGVRA